jgi:hypothetical protein
MKDDIQQITKETALRFISGDVDMFVIRKFFSLDGIDLVEAVSFGLLLNKDVLSSLVFETDATVHKMFPVGSIVWLQKQGEGIRITESTCLDALAQFEVDVVRQKLESSLQRDAIQIFEGHNRLKCVGIGES